MNVVNGLQSRLQTHVTFCECLMFHEFRWNVYNTTLVKYFEQEGIAGSTFFGSSLYAVFSSMEEISRYESSCWALYEILNTFCQVLYTQSFHV